MIQIAPKLYRTVHGWAGRLRAMHDEFRTAKFMNSLPESIRKDIGWPDIRSGLRDDRCTRGR